MFDAFDPGSMDFQLLFPHLQAWCELPQALGELKDNLSTFHIALTELPVLQATVTIEYSEASVLNSAPF